MANDVFPVIPGDIPAQAADTIGRSPDFDYAARAFRTVDGALREVSGKEAVRQWIALMLRQQPGKIPIYRTGGETPPGVDRSVLGRRLPDGLARAELERAIRGTLSFCPAVRAADRFVFTRTRRGLEVGFAVYLHTGDELEVTHIVGGA